jgi:hypothetical protein
MSGSNRIKITVGNGMDTKIEIDGVELKDCHAFTLSQNADNDMAELHLHLIVPSADVEGIAALGVQTDIRDAAPASSRIELSQPAGTAAPLAPMVESTQ